MAVEATSSIFCTCGGMWIVKTDETHRHRLFNCPLCGAHKAIPEDTSLYQIQFK